MQSARAVLLQRPGSHDVESVQSKSRLAARIPLVAVSIPKSRFGVSSMDQDAAMTPALERQVAQHA